MTDRELLRHIGRSAGRRAGYKQLVRELGLGGGRERRILMEQLDRLVARGELVHPDRDHWALPDASLRDNLAAGRLDMHRDGYGFVRPDTGRSGGESDIFIAPIDMGGAMQGDQVLVELAPPRSDGRRAGRIVRILRRNNPTIVGRFHHARDDRARGHSVTPWDERMTQPIFIAFGMELPAERDGLAAHRVLGREASRARQESRVPADAAGRDLEGLVVEVEILEWPTAVRPARGRVIEILGHPDDFGVDVEITIRKHHLPHVFPGNVLEEAREIAHIDAWEVGRREDFRGLPIVTIDGETAKDFDDAVLVRKDGEGWQLEVHIADVAQYVRPGSALDLEARLRGTSVYFPDRAVPMLPQELSSGICSLRPGEDRLVLSCIMRVDAEGEVESYRIVEGVIRSAQRMTYTQVHAALDGDEATRQEFAPLVPEFERMYELARLLHRKRQRRGSIDFDLPEPVIEFNEQGGMESIVRSERSWANRLIEEFMLSANECVASWLEQLSVPALYRIHEKPEPRRVVEFEDVAAGFGYSLGLGALPVKRVTMKADRRTQRAHGGTARAHEIPEDLPVTPRMYQQLALKIAGKPEERILAHLMLRSLRQARYSEKNEGHFALAAPCYTHFTSPIRRYPDLIVHRIVKELLQAGLSGEGRLAPIETRQPARARRDESSEHPPMADSSLGEAELAGIAQESSQAERRADDAERELMDWKKVKFMQERVGEDFDAMILSVTKYGCFVELDNLFIEGLAPIATLAGDNFTFRENTRQILGEHSGRRYSIGDRVRVILDRVNVMERRLQFSILEGEPLHLPRAAKKSTKTKAAARKEAKRKAHGYVPPPKKALGKAKRRGKNGKKRR
ncbi:MAG TPA: VacB/RNase II family 3'-5' exoribonuclease [Acidobacteriaceae bacterium]|nr:VacB/RNase II family 3'-5' exoribonuclease [Acidobacteriaceae bacterium]